jgi:hypothetical protein
MVQRDQKSVHETFFLTRKPSLTMRTTMTTKKTSMRRVGFPNKAQSSGARFIVRLDDFIDETHEAAQMEKTLDHIRTAERRRVDEEAFDVEAEAERLKQKYGRATFAEGREYRGDADRIPRQFLLPSVSDANLWLVKVKVNSPFAIFSGRGVDSSPKLAWKRKRNCHEPYAQSFGYGE